MKINTCNDTESSSSKWFARKFFPLEFTQSNSPGWDLRCPFKFDMELSVNAGTRCGLAVMGLPFHSITTNA